MTNHPQISQIYADELKRLETWIWCGNRTVFPTIVELFQNNPRESASICGQSPMLTDSNLRSAVDLLWDKLWSGGLSNPLDAIEQLSFLLFLKRLDEKEQDSERAAQRRGKKHTPAFPRKELRWSHWTQLPGDKALKSVKEEIFPFIKTLGGAGGSFAGQME